MAKSSCSREEDEGVGSPLFLVESYQPFEISTPAETLPGVIGSVLRLAGPVSVFYNRVREV